MSQRPSMLYRKIKADARICIKTVFENNADF